MRVRVVSQISLMDKTKMKIFAHLRGQNLLRRSAEGGVLFYKDLSQTPLLRGPPPGTFLPGVWSLTRTPGGGAEGG